MVEGKKWENKVKNQEEWRRIDEGRDILQNIKRRKLNWVGNYMQQEILLMEALEGLIDEKKEEEDGDSRSQRI